MGWVSGCRADNYARPRVIRGTRTAPLPLLPSGPGGVCGRPLHEARDLTSLYRNMAPFGTDPGVPRGCATQKWQIARIPFLWRVSECLDTLSTRRPPLMPNSLPELEAERSKLLRQFTTLGDLRPGSICAVPRRCGKPTCHCAKPNDPGHDPQIRLTRKIDGKTVAESFPSPAAWRKAQS